MVHDGPCMATLHMFPTNWPRCRGFCTQAPESTCDPSGSSSLTRPCEKKMKDQESTPKEKWWNNDWHSDIIIAYNPFPGGNIVALLQKVSMHIFWKSTQELQNFPDFLRWFFSFLQELHPTLVVLGRGHGVIWHLPFDGHCLFDVNDGMP